MPGAKYNIVKGDTFKLIDTIDDNSVDLIITSPPYNVGKVYEKVTDFQSYLNPYGRFANVLFNKLSQKGSLCWEVGNYVQNGDIYPLDIYFYDIFKEAGFKLRNRIVWHFEHGLHASKRFSGRYETICGLQKAMSILLTSIVYVYLRSILENYTTKEKRKVYHLVIRLVKTLLTFGAFLPKIGNVNYGISRM